MERAMTRGRQSIRAAILFAVCVGSSQAADQLTVRQAMDRALAANPSLRSQAIELRKQELEKEIARGQHWPKVDLNAGYTRYAYPSLVTPIREAGVFPPLDRDVAYLGLALSMPLYAGGRLVAGDSLAEHGRQAAEHGLRGAGQDLLFNVAAAYTKALHLRDLQDSARARIKALEAEEVHVSRRLAQGRAAKLELIRLQTQLSQARHDLLAIEQGERDALSLLAALLGESRELPPLAGVALSRVSLPASREDALAKAMRARPELLRARALSEVATDKVNIARGEQRPQVNLVARTQESAGGDLKGYSDAMIGVQVSIPLFDGSIRGNRLAQADLERRRSELLVEETANELASEVERAFGAVSESRARQGVADQGEREAVEAQRIETARYQAGESTMTDLLSAEAALWSARVNRLQAGYDVIVSQARLLRAIGELSAQDFELPNDAASKVSAENRNTAPLARGEEYVPFHRPYGSVTLANGSRVGQGALQ